MRKCIYVVLICTGLATACHRSPAEKYGTCAPIARASSAHVRGLGAAEYFIDDPEQIRKLLTFANARRVAGAVSDQELEAEVRLATELKHQTMTWLRKAHSELLKA